MLIVEQNANAPQFQLGAIELPPQLPPLQPAGVLSAPPASQTQPSSVINYETPAIDEIESAVKNINVSGYRLLIVMPKLKEKSAGGIEIPKDLLDKEKLAACIAYVAKAGPEAYADKRKFPSGPWCKEGEWIVLKSYSGTRIKSTINGLELRIINDDSVEAVIEDPSKFVRI